MKKILFFLFVLGVPVCGQGEVVSAVSYNPSRMGEYRYLKVAEEANLQGGLQTPVLNITTAGTVSAYMDNNRRQYDIPGIFGASGAAISMPNTVFHGAGATTYASYSAASVGIPLYLLPSVVVNGGQQTYLYDSYIRTLDAVNILRQKAGRLNAGTLSVTGNGGSTVSLYDNDDTYGFHLLGNDIPEPTGAHTNTGKSLSNCKMVWEKRKTSGNPAKEVWLLALQNCTEEGSSGNTCETNFQVNDECCNWIWSNRSGQMSSSEFTSCWSKCAGDIYTLSESSAYNPHSCPPPASSSNLCTIDPGVTSGRCDGKQGPSNAHCLVSTIPTRACQYYTASEASAATGGKMNLAGYYTFYRYRGCGNATSSCAISTSHMDFSNGPTSPVCYCRK